MKTIKDWIAKDMDIETTGPAQSTLNMAEMDAIMAAMPDDIVVGTKKMNRIMPEYAYPAINDAMAKYTAAEKPFPYPVHTPADTSEKDDLGM